MIENIKNQKEIKNIFNNYYCYSIDNRINNINKLNPDKNNNNFEITFYFSELFTIYKKIYIQKIFI